MGGIIFIVHTIVSIIILILLGKLEFSNNLFIILFVFVGYALLGFIDDYLILREIIIKDLQNFKSYWGKLLLL